VVKVNTNGQAGGKTPPVSVCIPLYRKERYVAETIQSVLNQTFTDFELIILNNASTDRSGEIAESFDDPRITVLHNAETVSAPENFAKLVPLTRAPLVKMVAADDVLHPTALERQVAVLRDPRIALVSCRQNMIGEDSEIIYRDRSLRAADLIGHQTRTTVLRRVVRHGANPVGALVNVMFRRAAYDAAGGIPHAPFVTLDLAMWLEYLRYGDFYGMEETLVDFRIAQGSASAGFGRSGIDDQVRFIHDLRRANADIVRWSDAVYSTLRTPLMRLRHQLIVSAAGNSGSSTTRAAKRVLALSRGASS
jgi:glycosyltransferase involved in cell wall biosynthesis